MSESSDEDFPLATAKASNSAEDCLDLTLVDTDDEDGPSPTHQGGSYSSFGRYATSIRKREPDTKKRPAPKVVTPRAEKKRSSSGGANRRASSCKTSSGGLDEVPIGAVGYSFHKRWTFDKGEGTPAVEKWIHGEVVAILDNSWVVDGGRDRRCVYADGDVQDHSLEELSPSKGPSRTRVLAPVRRCTNNSCIMKRGLQEAIASAKDDGLLDEEDAEVERSPFAVDSDSKPASSSPEDLPALSGGTAATSDSTLEVSGDGYEASSPSGTSSQNNSDDNEGATASDGPMEGDKGQTDHVDADDDSEGSDLFASDDDIEEDEMTNQQVAPGAEEMDNESDDSVGSDLFKSDDDDSKTGRDAQTVDVGAEAQTRDVWGHNRNPFADDDASVASRFSYVEPNFVAQQAPPAIIKEEPEVKVKKERAKSLVTSFVAPPVVRMEPDCYYFAIEWGDRMQVVEAPLKNYTPPSKFNQHGTDYELLYSEVKSRESVGKSDDKMSPVYYRSYYVAVSGPGIEELDLKSALQSIGDFETLTYEKGAHKALSRLKLLVSPSCKDSDGLFMIHRLTGDNFEIIEDNGHLGCGFIPKSLLTELLGKSAGALRAFAIQVRIIGPSSLGIAKGMLVVKAGITTIQVPTSMLKVNKSDTTPLHTDVVLNIVRICPSKSHKAMGRLINNASDDLPKSDFYDLKPLCADVQRVMKCKGVSDGALEQYLGEFKDLEAIIKKVKRGGRSMPKRTVREYMAQFKEQNRLNHANLVGVIDPTGDIPRGHVFLTGMGAFTPLQILITRNPCSTGKDGIVVPVASWRELSSEAYQFLGGLRFGAVVFSLGDELPTKINDGDLDGDYYVCIWDERIVGEIISYVPDNEQEKDDFLQKEFRYEVDGKLCDSVVKQKVGDDRYLVETGPKEDRKMIELTRDQIDDTTDCIAQVVGHRAPAKAKGKSRTTQSRMIEFHCVWEKSGEQWISLHAIKEWHSGPPEALVDYIQQNNLLEGNVLPKTFATWVNEDIATAYVEEIVKHKGVRGKIEVLCKYSDGTEMWIPMEEAREDCKVFLGAYARKKNLFRKPGWEETDGFWLGEVRDLIQKKRSKEIGQLVSTLHGELTGASENLGYNHPETEIWGDAYKTSLDIDKHGGVVQLPRHLYRRLPKSLRTQNFVDWYTEEG